jgi:phage terminase large subunit-like protein
MIEVVDKYCQDILTEKIPSCINVKNAVTRYLEDRKNGWNFREDKFEKVVNRIYKLKHFVGRHNKNRFKLEPWQMFITANLYGFYNQDGFRRFQNAYLSVARKNGKTALVGGYCINGLDNDDEAAPQILLAANSKDQAKIAFEIVSGFIEGEDPNQKRFERLRADIILLDKTKKGKPYERRTPAYIKILAADSDKLDGYNASLGVIDEYHSAPDSTVKDVIGSSQGMRENPMLAVITTAGFEKSLPCYDLNIMATEIAAGIKKDDSFFSMVFTLDDGDDWRDPKNWIKSNPNLDVTVLKSFVQKEINRAVNSPKDEVGVKTKHLNVWCDSATVWIPDEYVIKSSKKLNFDDFKGQECYVGVDLASNVDLTAVSYLFVQNNTYNFFVDYYVPKETLDARNLHADKDLYRQWVGNKYLKTTAGNVTDYDYITADLLKNNERSPIDRIYYDKYNATAWAIQCTEQGLKMEPFGQSIGNFNNCTRAFERLMLGGRVVIDDNPITRYCLRNVELRFDFNANCKPNKANEKKKIDGVIAMLQSLAAYIDATSNYKGTNIF